MTQRTIALRLSPEPLLNCAQVEDVNVHYESCGAGPNAVIFIQGWTCDSTFWRSQRALCRRHRSRALAKAGPSKQ
jgi:pimeloyl-ACP methyl ester carboxylesterase